ncbi:MAG: metallophosphoesterase family protein [Acidobacteriota bacterium]
MKIIAHISDLHFNSINVDAAQALLTELAILAPTLVAISGDLTQRARQHEFIAARAYLAQLSAPYLVVPGNHDIPLYDIVRRINRPLERYRKYISDDLNPCYLDEEIAVLGINTARALSWKSGSLSMQQITDLRRRLQEFLPSIFKVVVTHHPFIPPPGRARADLVRGATQALAAMEDCGADLLLAGHLHRSYNDDIRSHYPTTRRSILVAQAGTAISTRERGEPNTYNIIRIDQSSVEISLRVWNGQQFTTASTTCYIKQAGEWRPQK